MNAKDIVGIWGAFNVENWVRLLVAVRVGECEMRVTPLYDLWLDLILMKESTRNKTRRMFLRRSSN